jgi:hypothetical protein
MAIRKQRYSVPYNPRCASGGPRIHCIAYSLINGLRDTIKEKIKVGDLSIDTLGFFIEFCLVASMQVRHDSRTR